MSGGRKVLCHSGLWVGTGLAGALLVARFTEVSPFPIPQCGLRVLTGIPCPLCGSTRTLIALSHLELGQAFILNPLVAMACLGVVSWCIVACLRKLAGLELSIPNQWRSPARLNWIGMALTGLVLVNWVYLIFNLPP